MVGRHVAVSYITQPSINKHLSSIWIYLPQQIKERGAQQRDEMCVFLLQWGGISSWRRLWCQIWPTQVCYLQDRRRHTSPRRSWRFLPKEFWSFGLTRQQPTSEIWPTSFTFPKSRLKMDQHETQHSEESLFPNSVLCLCYCFLAEMGKIPCCGRPESSSSNIW